MQNKTSQLKNTKFTVLCITVPPSIIKARTNKLLGNELTLRNQTISLYTS